MLLLGLNFVKRARLSRSRFTAPWNLLSRMGSCSSFPIHPIHWPNYFVHNIRSVTGLLLVVCHIVNVPEHSGDYSLMELREIICNEH